MIIFEATKLVILSFLRLQNDPKLSQASFISLLPFAMMVDKGWVIHDVCCVVTYLFKEGKLWSRIKRNKRNVHHFGSLTTCCSQWRTNQVVSLLTQAGTDSTKVDSWVRITDLFHCELWVVPPGVGLIYSVLELLA